VYPPVDPVTADPSSVPSASSTRMVASAMPSAVTASVTVPEIEAVPCALGVGAVAALATVTPVNVIANAATTDTRARAVRRATEGCVYIPSPMLMGDTTHDGDPQNCCYELAVPRLWP